MGATTVVTTHSALHAALSAWLGPPSWVLNLSRASDPTELDILFFQPPGQYHDPDNEHVTGIATAGMSVRGCGDPPNCHTELFMGIAGRFDRSTLERLGRHLATLACVPFDHSVCFTDGMVLLDVRLPPFEGMTAAVLTGRAVWKHTCVAELLAPVRLLAIIPLFAEEAAVVQTIGIVEAYRQFRRAGANWYDPMRRSIDLVTRRRD